MTKGFAVNQGKGLTCVQVTIELNMSRCYINDITILTWLSTTTNSTMCSINPAFDHWGTLATVQSSRVLCFFSFPPPFCLCHLTHDSLVWLDSLLFASHQVQLFMSIPESSFINNQLLTLSFSIFLPDYKHTTCRNVACKPNFAQSAFSCSHFAVRVLTILEYCQQVCSLDVSPIA